MFSTESLKGRKVSPKLPKLSRGLHQAESSVHFALSDDTDDILDLDSSAHDDLMSLKSVMIWFSLCECDDTTVIPGDCQGVL